jgi:methionine synthase II (cobalamin-independent)
MLLERCVIFAAALIWAMPSGHVQAAARAIERAENTLGPDRVTYVHPDCGFWMLKRTIADGKMRALVRGRDLYEGRPA